MSAAATTKKTTKIGQWPHVVGNTAVLGLWLWLYRPVFDYLAIIFSREDFRTNQILLLGVLFLIANQIRKGDWQLQPSSPPRLAILPLALALGSSTLYLIVERILDVNTISASLFGLASYGLLGLWLEPERWRRGIPAILLLIGVLPFGDHMQTFIGYPMRILTAAIVGDGLAAAGVASIGVDTILIFENGVSQIDLPCSGVKSLWTGMLFLLAATWVEERPLTKRWFLIANLFVGLLFIANLARVAILVTIGEVMGWHMTAEMLHVPLGVLGFAAACAAAVWLLRRIETRDWRLEAKQSLASSLQWLADTYSSRCHHPHGPTLHTTATDGIDTAVIHLDIPGRHDHRSTAPQTRRKRMVDSRRSRIGRPDAL